MLETSDGSTPSDPELVVRLNVGDSRAEVIDEFARREGVESVRREDSAGATMVLGRFRVGDSDDRRETMETIADRVHEVCARWAGCKFEMLELRLTMIPDDSMNVDFYLPRRLLLDAVEHDVDILIAAF